MNYISDAAIVTSVLSHAILCDSCARRVGLNTAQILGFLEDDVWLSYLSPAPVSYLLESSTQAAQSATKKTHLTPYAYIRV